MEALKKNADKSISKDQNRYNKDFDENVRTTLTIEVGQFFCMNEPLRGVLTSEATKVDTVSYSKPVSRQLGLQKIVTVRDNTVTIRENGIENTARVNRAIKVPVCHDQPDTNCDIHNTRELSRTQANKTDNNDSNRFVVDEIVRHVTEYVVHWSGYPPKKNTAEPAHDLPQHFVICYRRKINRRKLRHKSPRNDSQWSA